jgi:hypothetical protein
MPDELDTAIESPHPDAALVGFNPRAEKIKFVIGKILKFAVIGAVVGGIVLAGAAIMAGVSLGGNLLGAGGAFIGAGGKAMSTVAMAGPWGMALAAITTIGLTIASGIGLWNASTIGGWVLSGLATSALAGVAIGVVAGAVVGAVYGFSGMDEAVDNKADRLQAKLENEQMRTRRYNSLVQQWRKQNIELAKQEQALGIYHGGMIPVLARNSGRQGR